MFAISHATGAQETRLRRHAHTTEPLNTLSAPSLIISLIFLTCQLIRLPLGLLVPSSIRLLGPQVGGARLPRDAWNKAVQVLEARGYVKSHLSADEDACCPKCEQGIPSDVGCQDLHDVPYRKGPSVYVADVAGDEVDKRVRGNDVASYNCD